VRLGTRRIDPANRRSGGGENPTTTRRSVGDMALARYKDLCIDVNDSMVAGRFWADVLGLTLVPAASGGVRLAGPTPAHTVWVNQVPEAKAAKYRVHLDVHGGSVDEMLTLGAAVVDDTSFRWVVMTDPEGAEFCLFRRDVMPEYRLHELGVDAADHHAIASWWADVLGGTLGSEDDGSFSWVEAIPNAPFDGIAFASVPEPKAGKNRVHIDVVADDIQPLLDAGATLVRARDGEIAWNVLADPEGNEFCVFDER
jgi:predicted enzyme related to lactoylglutathione lyase